MFNVNTSSISNDSESIDFSHNFLGELLSSEENLEERARLVKKYIEEDKIVASISLVENVVNSSINTWANNLQDVLHDAMDLYYDLLKEPEQVEPDEDRDELTDEEIMLLKSVESFDIENLNLYKDISEEDMKLLKSSAKDLDVNLRTTKRPKEISEENELARLSTVKPKPNQNNNSQFNPLFIQKSDKINKSKQDNNNINQPLEANDISLSNSFSNNNTLNNSDQFLPAFNQKRNSTEINDANEQLSTIEIELVDLNQKIEEQGKIIARLQKNIKQTNAKFYLLLEKIDGKSDDSNIKADELKSELKEELKKISIEMNKAHLKTLELTNRYRMLDKNRDYYLKITKGTALEQQCGEKSKMNNKR